MNELPWAVEGLFGRNVTRWGVRARCAEKDIAESLLIALRRNFPNMEWRVRDTRLDAPPALGMCYGCKRPGTHRDGKYACCGSPQHCVAAIPPAPLDCRPDDVTPPQPGDAGWVAPPVPVAPLDAAAVRAIVREEFGAADPTVNPRTALARAEGAAISAAVARTEV